MSRLDHRRFHKKKLDRHTEISQAEQSQAKSPYTELLQVGRLQTERPLHSAIIKETVSQIMTPQQIRPLSKAEPRKSTIRRKKENSLILTLVKENLKEETRLRKEKANKTTRTKNKKKAVQRRSLEGSPYLIMKVSPIDSPEEFDEYDDNPQDIMKVSPIDSPEEFDEYDDNPQDVSNGDYVIVKFTGKINRTLDIMLLKSIML
ncbi:hypothetical protein QE152_g22711 [Popillia japonica]|uniref:Uncharacterized protein n=1 Tax=Popillia japonica TaxID=7064 RepID=A0AAW1KHU7_POPJA